MEVLINGELRDVVSTSLSDLISELGLSQKKLAIELNKEIVSRDLYSEQIISAGDTLEIVHFIGGG